MKKALLLLLISCSLAAVGQVGTAAPVIVTGTGQPIPGAKVAVCTSNPFPTLIPPCGEPANALAQTYTSPTLVTKCTLNPTTLGPLSGVGCTNPGVTDGLGNAAVFSVLAGAWYEVYGYAITTYAAPISFGGSISVPGVFTNTQMNEYLTSKVGNCNTTTEQQALNGPFNSTNAISGCVALPVGATVGGAIAVAGYANTSATGLPAATGVAGQSRCLAADTKCVGGAATAGDLAGLGATGDVELFGGLSEIFQNNASGTYQIVQGHGIVGIFASAPPSFATALNIQGVGFPWPKAINVGDGSATTAMIAGAACGSGSCASQPYALHGMTTGTPDTNVIIYVGKGVPSAGTCGVGKAGLYIREDGAQNTTLYSCDSTTGGWNAVTVP